MQSYIKQGWIRKGEETDMNVKQQEMTVSLWYDMITEVKYLLKQTE